MDYYGLASLYINILAWEPSNAKVTISLPALEHFTEKLNFHY